MEVWNKGPNGGQDEQCQGQLENMPTTLSQNRLVPLNSAGNWEEQVHILIQVADGSFPIMDFGSFMQFFRRLHGLSEGDLDCLPSLQEAFATFGEWLYPSVSFSLTL